MEMEEGMQVLVEYFSLGVGYVPSRIEGCAKVSQEAN